MTDLERDLVYHEKWCGHLDGIVRRVHMALKEARVEIDPLYRADFFGVGHDHEEFLLSVQPQSTVEVHRAALLAGGDEFYRDWCWRRATSPVLLDEGAEL